MQDVHVRRHKVLVEGLSRRQVARELGISRNTVRGCLTLAEPVRVEREPRRKPVLERVLRGQDRERGPCARHFGAATVGPALGLHPEGLQLVGEAPSGPPIGGYTGGGFTSSSAAQVSLNTADPFWGNSHGDGGVDAALCEGL